MSSLREQFDEELKRIESQPGSHVQLEVDKTRAEAEAELALPKGWAVSAYARYYWNRTWDAGARVCKRWGLT